jgi:2-polyprenyl-6-methoxyphenol hydroxylase-like FAD-dependent oxidoreductase
MARAGHAVTLLERRTAADPAGTGLLLQPFALGALRALGVRDAVVGAGVAIDALQRFERGAEVLRLRYDERASGLFGVGIRRSALNGLLLDHARRAGALVRFGSGVAGIEEKGDAVGVVLEGGVRERFDLLVVADGLSSRLRGMLPLRATVRPCAWAVCSAIVSGLGGEGRSTLRQYHRSADAFIGLLPVDPAAPDTRSFFWNVPADSTPSLPASILHARRTDLARFFPPTDALLARLDPATELTVFSYAAVRMARWHTRRCVLIGDAAHGIDPQLGLGANLALVDGARLADCLSGVCGADVPAALSDYQKTRAPAVRRFERAGRSIAPLLQSDALAARMIRGAVFGLARRSVAVRRAMLGPIAGDPDQGP